MKSVSRHSLVLSLVAVGLYFLTGCSDDSSPTNPPAPIEAENLVAQVVATYPHDSLAFTQGLQWVDTAFVEGTGLKFQSTLRLVDLPTGNVLYSRPLPPPPGGDSYFGEGVCVVGDRIYQLTWKGRIGFIYDKNTFDSVGYFTYPTEGWGLTWDGSRFIMSDGTSRIYFWDSLGCHDCAALDPDSIPHITVHDLVGPITRCNELEFINGAIYANIWQTRHIVKIDPSDGTVLARIDCSGVLTTEEWAQVNVLNGIAYDSTGDRLFLTGKYWPKLFEVELVKTDSLP